MKTIYSYPCISIAIVLLIAVFVLFAGCTSQPASQPAVIQSSGTVSASLPYGVTITYPSNWTRQDVLTSGVRDYGTTTLSIANFYSPVVIPGDQASYTSLSVDLDKNPGTDVEKYFNNATLAITKSYGDPTRVSAHSYTVMIGDYKSYELDFETNEVKGTYFFTSTENGMYIFAFKTPNKPLAVQAFQAQITDIYKSIRINPPTVDVTQHR
jgi:hypothetical protein